MVSAKELNKLFIYKDGKLYWRFVEGRRKETNNRFSGKEAGSLLKGGYKIVSYNCCGKKYKQLIHRVIYAMHYDAWPAMIDHIDREPKNNCVENLRPADKRLNSINRGKPANNTSGVRGISWNKRVKRWEVYIKDRQKRYNLGHYDCFGQAIRARKSAEKVFWNDV